jgi:hypothetical protein
MGIFEDLEEGKNVFEPVSADKLKEIFEELANTPQPASQRDLVLFTGQKSADMFDTAVKNASKDEYIKSCMEILDNCIATGKIDLDIYLKLKRLIDTRQNENIKLAMNLLNAKCGNTIEKNSHQK